MSLLFLGLLFCVKFSSGLDNLEEILKLKCEGLLQRSVFSEKTCFVVESTSRSCNDIYLPYSKLVKTSSNKLPRKHKLNDVPDSQICAFKLRDDCEDGDVVGDKCVQVSEKTVSFLTAAKNCNEKGYSLFVPHNDKDLQQLLEATSYSRGEYFWIGAASIGSQWQFHDGSAVDFFRIKPSSDFLSQEMGLVFQGKGKNDSYVGYTIVQGIDNKFNHVCSKVILEEYRVPYETIEYERRTTTTTTTTTKKPTTTKPVQCTGTWSEWIPNPTSVCNDICGNCGLIPAYRNCIPSGCKCMGPSTSHIPCGNSVCLFPRRSCCVPYTKKIVGSKFICG